MDYLRRELYLWRDNEAARRGVEFFRVLPNSTLDAIASRRPKTKEELTAIKGIKEAKWKSYGREILAIIEKHTARSRDNPNPGTLRHPSRYETEATISVPITHRDDVASGREEYHDAYSVSAYLDIVNDRLARIFARVRGEIIQFKIQGSALYATIKDTEDDSVLSLFMWKRDFDLSGIELAEGMEVVVEGRSEIYKPNGRFNFCAQTIALVGEGALKKAYEELRKKLDAEGLFAPERKRPVPQYPERIGLITSKTGAVINDFLSNLGKRGYRIRFCDSRVEGAAAIRDILSAIERMKAEDIDVLVLIRGGGRSLELLQTFNNEHVVRAIATFPKPVICAIGHDKDVPLAQLAADLAPSTPSLCAMALNKSWEDGVHLVRYFTKDIISLYHEQLWVKNKELQLLAGTLRSAFQRIAGVVTAYERQLTEKLMRIRASLVSYKERLRNAEHILAARFTESLRGAAREINEVARVTQSHNPLRQLKLGYSIITVSKRIIRNVGELPPGTAFEARLSDGTIVARAMEKQEKTQW